MSEMQQTFHDFSDAVPVDSAAALSTSAARVTSQPSDVDIPADVLRERETILLPEKYVGEKVYQRRNGSAL